MLKSALVCLIAASLPFLGSCGSKGDEPRKPGNGNPGIVNPTPDPDPEPDPEPPTGKIIVAYVTCWSSVLPNPRYMTHINYAFGHVTDNFKGVRIDNDQRLRQIANLKKNNPDLKVLLSVGGWGSGRFSEMAADAENRSSFAKDCKRVIDQYNLDGIDIDWEFPGNDASGLISCSPNDTKNYTLLMQDIREAIGPDHLLTLATVVSGDYIDLADIMPYVDFVNIMAYDMENAPKHNAGLYRSKHTGWICGDEGVKRHLKKGVPADKLVLGMPFYGHGKSPYAQTVDYKDIHVLSGCTERWDDVAKSPYMENANGELVLSYDNARSLSIKCDYIIENGLKGAMYWDYAGDDANSTLRSAVAKKLIGLK